MFCLFHVILLYLFFLYLRFTWPSLDLHSCPQSAEYDCSPQAKEQEWTQYIFFVQVFPQSARDGTEKRPKDAILSSFSSGLSSSSFFQSHSSQVHPRP